MKIIIYFIITNYIHTTYNKNPKEWTPSSDL